MHVLCELITKRPEQDTTTTGCLRRGGLRLEARGVLTDTEHDVEREDACVLAVDNT